MHHGKFERQGQVQEKVGTQEGYQVINKVKP